MTQFIKIMLLKILHAKKYNKKVRWVSIVSSELVADMYMLEQFEEFYSVFESRCNFLSPKEKEIRNYIVSKFKILLAL